MARYKDAVCRLCRREGMKLFLKGAKCFTDKCPIEKRNFAPGQHGKDRKAKIVGYGLQLREKQKAKRIYFTQENQFRNYFERAARTRGRHRRSAAATTGAPSRQRGLSPRLCGSAAPGAPVGASRSRAGERQEGRHSFLPGECRRRNRRARDAATSSRCWRLRRILPAIRRRRHGWKSTATPTRDGWSRCRRGTTSTCPSMSS